MCGLERAPDGGRLVLDPTNNDSDYEGVTTISAGELVIRQDSALGLADGTAASQTVVTAGALVLDGGVTVGNELLRLAGNGLGVTGALRSTGGTNTWGTGATTITVTASTVIGVNAGELDLNAEVAQSAAGFTIFKLLPGTLFNNGVEYTENVHLLERFRLADANTLVVTQQFEDAGSFEGTAARVMSFRRGNDHVYPYDCDPTYGLAIESRGGPGQE